MTLQELRRRAFLEAAAIVEYADLEKFFGSELSESDKDHAAQAQLEVARFLRQRAVQSGSPARREE